MRILFVTASRFWASGDGDSIRSHGVLSAISRFCDVDVVYVGTDTIVDASASHRVRVIRWVVGSNTPAGRLGRLIRPGLFGRSWSRDLCRHIESLLASGAYSAVHFDGLQFCEYALRLRRYAILDIRDTWSRLYFQRAKASGGLAPLIAAKGFGFLVVERCLIAAGLPIALLSRADLDYWDNLFGDCGGAFLLPNGVSPPPIVHSSRRTQGLVVFCGAFDYLPNRDGLLWFLGSVWDRVHKLCPHAQFRIVGRSAPLELANSDRGVQVEANVPSVAPHLQEAHVIVCPLRMGTGIKNKVLEALAFGRGLVATPVAMDGIPATPGSDYVSASTADEFVRALCSLISDISYADELGRAGRAFVSDRFSWNYASEVLMREYAGVQGSVRERSSSSSRPA